MIDHERLRHGAQIDQVVPIAIVASQAGSFDRQNRADLTAANGADKLTEAGSFLGATAAATQVFVNDLDLVEAQCPGSLLQTILATLALAPLPFGSVQPRFVAALEVVAALLAAGALWSVYRDPSFLGPSLRRVVLPAALLILVGLLQLAPLPPGVV